MLNEKMVALGTARSVIRELFEYGKQRAAVVGEENVFDFSIGNPSVPAPPSVNEEAVRLLREMDPVVLHGYTSAAGDPVVKSTLASALNARYGMDSTGDNLYCTVGAAAALCCCLNGLCNPGDEVIVFAPYFPEYKVFIEKAGAKMVLVPPEIEGFQIDFDTLESLIGPATKAVLVNSPNNPSGVVYSEATIRKLSDLLETKSAELGRPVYLISDEPYREIVYTGAPLPWVPDYYPDTLVCYSYSKSLSLPGQRIGYVLVPRRVTDFDLVYAAVCGAGRALGYVCAPALFQLVVAQCGGLTSDLSVYRTNRDLLLDSLRSMGYTCAQADGAFYLFPRTPEPDARAFCERARKYDLVLVPGDSFGCPGHVRVSYCVPTEQIRRALPKFRALAAEYGLGK